jgi:hypothetical protein
VGGEIERCEERVGLGPIERDKIGNVIGSHMEDDARKR